MAKLKDKTEYANPTGCCVVASYALHLYCANSHSHRDRLDGIDNAEIDARTKAKAFGIARKAGWIISEKKDIAICPQCAKAKKY